MNEINKVSVVLLNCKREDNVRYLVDAYSDMEVVDELIVWSSPPGDFRSKKAKVKTATCTPDWGMFPRYLVSMMAAS